MTKYFKTPLAEIRDELTNLDVNLTDKELNSLSYNELMKVVKLAKKKREIERKLVAIVYKENVENT
jgi:hypothetical protein